MEDKECVKASGNYRRYDKIKKNCYNDTISYKNLIKKEMICAEAKHPVTGVPTSTCKGDSGGPYTVIDKNQHYLVGVMSWKAGCAEVIVKTQLQLTQTQPTLSCV